MKRYCQLFSFLFIFIHSGFAQLNSTKPEELKYLQMLELLDSSRSAIKSDADSMKFYAERAYDLSRELAVPDSLSAIIISNYALSLIESADYETALTLLTTNIKFIESTQHLQSLSSFYTSYGTYYLKNNRPEKAIAWYFKSYEIDQRMGNTFGKAKSLVNIAFIQKRIGNHRDALANFMNGLKLCEEANDQQMVLRILVNITGYYNDRNAPVFNIDSAILYGRKSVALSRELDFPFGEAMSSINLSAALMTKNLEVLKSELEVMEGLEAATFARTFFENTNFTQQFHNSLLNEGLAYEILRDFEKATAISNQLINSPFVASFANEMSFRISKKAGNYEEALKAHERFKFIVDSLAELNQQNQLAELETKYETALKDSEIESLSQEKAISVLKIRQKNTQILILVLGSVFGLTLLYLFFQQRSIRAKHQHSELEHRFLRFQLNPHFIFNALASIQNYMLKNNSKDAGIYLAKFSKLMRQILENSRQEFIPIAEEVIMLENYLDVHQLNTTKPFTYEINIDENIVQEAETIPPMFVQPFVENAIEHGISSASSNGHIKLNFSKQGKFIRVEILDNGGGFTATIRQLDHKSLATKIIQERIDLFNQNLKEKIKFIVEEIIGDEGKIVGTKVALTVPFSYF